MFQEMWEGMFCVKLVEKESSLLSSCEREWIHTQSNALHSMLVSILFASLSLTLLMSWQNCKKEEVCRGIREREREGLKAYRIKLKVYREEKKKKAVKLDHEKAGTEWKQE